MPGFGNHRTPCKFTELPCLRVSSIRIRHIDPPPQRQEARCLNRLRPAGNPHQFATNSGPQENRHEGRPCGLAREPLLPVRYRVPVVVGDETLDDLARSRLRGEDQRRIESFEPRKCLPLGVQFPWRACRLRGPEKTETATAATPAAHPWSRPWERSSSQRTVMQRWVILSVSSAAQRWHRLRPFETSLMPFSLVSTCLRAACESGWSAAKVRKLGH